MKIKVEKKSNITIYNPANEEEGISFVLLQPAIQNKSKKFVEHLNTILIETKEEQWYYNILYKFKSTQDHDVVYNEFLDKACEIARRFSDIKDELYPTFADKKKKTDNSVFFEISDIKEIYMINILVKLMVPFTGTTLVENDQERLTKMAFQYVIEKEKLNIIIEKIHDLVNRKLFRCVGLDPTVLNTVKLKSTMSDHDFVLYLFDYIISAILAIYDLERNPITFIVTSVDSIMTWHFKGLYQKAIAYKPTGELFGKTMGTTNLPEKIIAGMIYEYVQKTVTIRNRELGVSIDDGYENIDKYFYTFFTIPFFKKLFDIKDTDIEYNNFELINIQLFLYYTLKDFMEETKEDVFPRLNREVMVKDKSNTEEFKFLELLKRVPVGQNSTYTLLKQTVFENSEFLIDDFTGNARNNHSLQYSGLYKIESLPEILTSNFKFYGINNIMILNNYLKGIMNILMNLVFKKVFTFDLTTVDFKCRKYAKELEQEIYPMLMIILDNKFEWYDHYKEWVFKKYCSEKATITNQQ